MAVEAHRLLPVSRGRGAVDASESNQSYGERADLASTRHQGVAGLSCVPPVAATESAAATFAHAAAPSRKRARGEEQFLGAAVHDVHPAVLRHAERMAAELEQWRRRYAAHVAAAAKAAVAAGLKAKDEEIERARWLNWQLQEQLRAVHAEAQVWRDAAVSGEAAAAVLRADLDRALRALARVEAEATADADDAESCCYGDNGGGDGTAGGDGECEPATDTDRRGVGTCRGCSERAAAAVLLPCRHLSACAPCAAAAWACPACRRHKVGSVAVNPV